MAAGSVSRRIEAALERVVERPFTRRAALDLPLMKMALKRAMEDELKQVPPSRYVLAVSEEQAHRIGPSLREWEAELGEYFLSVVQESGWSAISPARVQIVYDPAISGNDVMVSVDESYLVHHGRTLRRKKRSGFLLPLAASLAVILACGYLLALLAAPELLPRGVPSPRLPTASPVAAVDSAWRTAHRQLAVWWEGASETATEATRDRLRWASRELGDAVPRRATGEVVASPWLTVRAGSPSTRSETSPAGRLPSGTVVSWWSHQVVQGESIGGEDRWVEIGRAGPEWGDLEGQKLYLWLGGLQVR